MAMARQNHDFEYKRNPDFDHREFVYPGSDGWIYTHSRLRNRLGIRDREQLDPHIDKNTVARMDELRTTKLIPVVSQPSVVLFRHLHQYIFQDVYHWAGEFRSDYLGMEQRVRSVIAESNRLAGNFLGLTRSGFVERMSGLVTDLAREDSFFDGNRRTIMAFAERIADHAGYQLDWKPKQWTPAWRDAKRILREESRDTGFVTIIKDATNVPRALAFDRFPREAALAKYPELAGAYQVLAGFQKALHDSGISQAARQPLLKTRRDHMSRVLHDGRLIAGVLDRSMSQDRRPVTLSR
jgi:cell filamentation protein